MGKDLPKNKDEYIDTGNWIETKSNEQLYNSLYSTYKNNMVWSYKHFLDELKKRLKWG
jgi:hypothetical protein